MATVEWGNVRGSIQEDHILLGKVAYPAGSQGRRSQPLLDSLPASLLPLQTVL